MQLSEAMKMRLGRKVKCPPDQGSPGYTGIVVGHDKETKFFTPLGSEYIFVTVLGPQGKQSLWPSSRLG